MFWGFISIDKPDARVTRLKFKPSPIKSNQKRKIWIFLFCEQELRIPIDGFGPIDSTLSLVMFALALFPTERRKVMCVGECESVASVAWARDEMCDVCSEWCQASPGGEDSRCLPGPGSGSWLGYREGSSDHWPHPFHHQPPAQTLTTRNTQHIRHQLQCKTNYTVKHTVKSLMNTPSRHCLQCNGGQDS